MAWSLENVPGIPKRTTNYFSMTNSNSSFWNKMADFTHKKTMIPFRATWVRNFKSVAQIVCRGDKRKIAIQTHSHFKNGQIVLNGQQNLKI